MLRDGIPVLTAEMRAIIDGIDALALNMQRFQC